VVEREDRRTQVLKHAERVFARKGFHETNISDIIAEAGIARGTFYLYFENKRDLFAELLDRVLEELRGRVQRVRQGPGEPPPVAQLRANLHRVFEFILSHPELADIMLHHASGFDPELDARLLRFSEQIVTNIERALNLGIEMQLVRPCDTRLTAICFLGVIREVMADVVRTSNGVNGRSDASIDELADAVLTLGLRGVATPRLFDDRDR
jgi:AcrR family transcriptional regulator